MVLSFKKKMSRKTTRKSKKSKKISKPLRRAVQQIINKNVETKHKNIVIDNTAITTSGLLVSITDAVTQGITSDARLGDFIRMQRFVARTRVFLGDTYNIFRMIVGYSKTPLSATNCFQAINSNVLGIWNQDQFPVYMLYDRALTLGSGAINLASIIGPTVNSNLRNFKVHYDNEGTSLTLQGQLFVYFVSDSSAAPHPSLYMQSKLTYQDA